MTKKPASSFTNRASQNIEPPSRKGDPPHPRPPVPKGTPPWLGVPFEVVPLGQRPGPLRSRQVGM